jgi:hypothetical protein
MPDIIWLVLSEHAAAKTLSDPLRAQMLEIPAPSVAYRALEGAGEPVVVVQPEQATHTGVGTLVRRVERLAVALGEFDLVLPRALSLVVHERHRRAAPPNVYAERDYEHHERHGKRDQQACPAPEQRRYQQGNDECADDSRNRRHDLAVPAARWRKR